MEPDRQNLRIFRRESPVKVLGPFARAVVWVQGCTFACPNCIVPESWRLDAGELISIDALSSWIVDQPTIEGITLSGGEPMLQAKGLAALIDAVRHERELGVVCYTGFTREYLASKGSLEQKEMLNRIDLLIDGVYLEGRHESLLWRGSSNQRIIQLTDRYRTYLETVLGEQGDSSVGVEVVMDEAGGIGYAGVPARPGFRESFISGMNARGIRLSHQLSKPPFEAPAEVEP